MKNDVNGILVVNKPKGLTSRDVVNKVSKILHTKKVGHTGTLDPIASGVLIICLGNATKLCELLTSEYKEYIGTIKLGIRTDTLDITGNLLEKQTFNISEEKIIKVLNSFLGKSIQTTPLYSAVKVNGKKLYEYARAGIKVELPKREIDIKEIELLSFKDYKIVFRAIVSKGTYIRALIEDICTSLKTIGTMSDLIRTKQGLFKLEDAMSLEEIDSQNLKILTIEDVLKDIETLNIDKNLYEKVKNGAIINKKFKDNIASLKYNGKIIALYQVYEKDIHKAKPYKMFI